MFMSIELDWPVTFKLRKWRGNTGESALMRWRLVWFIWHIADRKRGYKQLCSPLNLVATNNTVDTTTICLTALYISSSRQVSCEVGWVTTWSNYNDFYWRMSENIVEGSGYFFFLLTKWVVTVPVMGPVLRTAGMLLQMGTGLASIERLLQDGPAPPADRRPAGLSTAWPLRPLTHHTGHRWRRTDRTHPTEEETKPAP